VQFSESLGELADGSTQLLDGSNQLVVVRVGEEVAAGGGFMTVRFDTSCGSGD